MHYLFVKVVIIVMVNIALGRRPAPPPVPPVSPSPILLHKDVPAAQAVLPAVGR